MDLETSLALVSCRALPVLGAGSGGPGRSLQVCARVQHSVLTPPGWSSSFSWVGHKRSCTLRLCGTLAAQCGLRVGMPFLAAWSLETAPKSCSWGQGHPAAPASAPGEFIS